MLLLVIKIVLVCSVRKDKLARVTKTSLGTRKQKTESSPTRLQRPRDGPVAADLF